ncbi:MAG: hypothetical protein KAR19_19285 [Bacteroidales bacterium]|nr:hypothetical protein [Bacteroidales bacterium]
MYGEEFYVSFENIEGFNRVDNYAYPGMQMIVISQNGDTVLRYNDLYSDLADGIDYSPLVLYAEATVADPIYSNNDYSLVVNIWDKKGEGTFTANLDFTVVPNDQIKIESNHISYDEIYLFSQQRQIVITDNTSGFNENIFMMFEGLEGFREEAGTVFPGLSITVIDSEGNLILDEEDLLGESGMNYSELNSRLAPNFILTGTHISNPVTCEITIWDKKGDGNIKASAQMNIE